MTLRSRSSASRPRWPPTSTFSVCGESVLSDAGRLTTSRQFAGELDGFGERLGEGELRLEAAGRQVALIVELTRVGDPLVDQDQARPVVDQKLPQGVPRAGGVLVVLGDAS